MEKLEPKEGFRDLSLRILSCANKIRPRVDFLIELSEILIEFSGCDAIEFWLDDKGTCSVWEGTKNPMRFTRLGNVTSNRLRERLAQGQKGYGGEEAYGPRPEGKCYLSIVNLPLLAGEDTIGLLVLKKQAEVRYSEEFIKLYQYVAQTVAIAVAYHKVQLEQRERVKELTCLYELAKTDSHPQKSIETILDEVVGYLPPAWQYPEITTAKIVLDESVFSTRKKGAVRHNQAADIVVDGNRRGFVEVGYLEDRPELDEGPFLAEERRLIDTIAHEVALIVERKRAEDERIRLQEQLRHADRLATIGQLAAGVAHELNEPLGGILGFAQLASKHPDLPAQAGNDLKKIEAASLHAREVVKKLMIFARQTPPSLKRVDLSELVEEGLYFLESRCAKAGIELVRNLSADLPRIVVDPSQIHQVLINLVVNSVQAMESGGKLTVETGCDQDSILLTVADTGCGMPDEVAEKIFVPFFTTKDVGEGTGLGLPVVHGIVTSHGGEIDVESWPGQGTRFVIRLPASSPADLEGKRTKR
jgi:signal transduction histidine kinase